jgi:hypothetical protein
VIRATEGGVRATKFLSGVMYLSEIETAEMMRKAKKRVVDFLCDQSGQHESLGRCGGGRGLCIAGTDFGLGIS